MKLEMLINKYYDRLNENDLATLRYITDHKKECAGMGIAELGVYCNISKSSILRTTQKLGFSGYSEFKYALKNDLNPMEPQKTNYFQQVLPSIENTLKLFRKNNLSPIYRKIDQASHIYAYGTGWAQQNAINDLKRNFMNSNRQIIDIPAKKELESVLPFFTEKDLMIIVSLSGEIADLIDDIRLMKMKKMAVLSITDTDFHNNELATLVPDNLYYQSIALSTAENSAKDQRSLITLFTLCDALYSGYLSWLRDNPEGR